MNIDISDIRGVEVMNGDEISRDAVRSLIRSKNHSEVFIGLNNLIKLIKINDKDILTNELLRFLIMLVKFNRCNESFKYLIFKILFLSLNAGIDINHISTINICITVLSDMNKYRIKVKNDLKLLRFSLQTFQSCLSDKNISELKDSLTNVVEIFLSNISILTNSIQTFTMNNSTFIIDFIPYALMISQKCEINVTHFADVIIITLNQFINNEKPINVIKTLDSLSTIIRLCKYDSLIDRILFDEKIYNKLLSILTSSDLKIHIYSALENYTSIKSRLEFQFSRGVLDHLFATKIYATEDKCLKSFMHIIFHFMCSDNDTIISCLFESYIIKVIEYAHICTVSVKLEVIEAISSLLCNNTQYIKFGEQYIQNLFLSLTSFFLADIYLENNTIITIINTFVTLIIRHNDTDLGTYLIHLIKSTDFLSTIRECNNEKIYHILEIFEEILA